MSESLMPKQKQSMRPPYALQQLQGMETTNTKNVAPYISDIVWLLP